LRRSYQYRARSPIPKSEYAFLYSAFLADPNTFGAPFAIAGDRIPASR
jgi:hypothetical protein